jgi:CBS domain-containing protein
MSKSTILGRIRTLLATAEPFNRLEESEREALLSDITVEYFNEGDVIIEQGSTTYAGLYVVESGTVQIMNVESQHLLKKCSEGDQFGAFPIIKGGASIYQAKAVEPTVCALINAKRFGRLLDENEIVASFFDNDIQQYVRRMDTHVDVGGAHLLFSRNLEELGLRAPVTCDPDVLVRDVARLMTKENVDAVLVKRGSKVIGIVTDVDIRRRFVARGLPADTTVRRIMVRHPATITSETSLFDALMRMLERRVNRLVVVRKTGRISEPIGILTDRDIAHYRGKDPLATAQYIERVKMPSELVSIREETNEQLQSLFEQGISPEQLSRLIATMYDLFAIRAIELVEQEMRAASSGPAVNLDWTWLRIGSSGRQESVLTSEQHNALLYDDPASEEEAVAAEAWFTRLAVRVSETLETCGFLTSVLVAQDVRYCKPLGQWKRQFREWIMQASREDVVEALRFFDLRGIYGKTDLVHELKQSIEDALNVESMDRNRQFIRLMAEHVLSYRAPQSFFERFVWTRSGDGSNRYNLRVRGILPIVEAARVLALDLRYLESTNTYDRLRHAVAKLPDMRSVLEPAIDAYRYFVDFRLEQQLNAVEGGDPPGNEIDLSSLSRMQQHILRRSSAAVTALQDAIADRYELNRKRTLLNL